MRRFPRILIYSITFLVWMAWASACGSRGESTLRLATTTSTYDSGLLDAILPEFEGQFDANVEVIAVGTGQALALGERGDVDLLLVHDPARERAFIDEGYGVERTVLMYNDFVLVGPSWDPAGVRALPSAAQAFELIAERQADFASRGDESGTHSREKQIWQRVGLQPTHDQDWYLSLGQGMGATLQFANERGAYTLSDRGTYLAQSDNLPRLEVLVGGSSFFENPDDSLLNCYSLMIVNPDRFPEVNESLAREFMRWINDETTKARIGEIGLDRFDQPLFYPADPNGEKPVPGQPDPSS